MTEKYFLVGVGTEGLEIVYDMTDEMPTEVATLRALQGHPPPTSRLASIQLRCRMNGQRNIVLTAFKAPPEFDTDGLWKMYENSPEAFNQMVKRVGVDVGY